jgi:5-hydroxyisourate hydrolase-like protein (transthyretin family)
MRSLTRVFFLFVCINSISALAQVSLSGNVVATDGNAPIEGVQLDLLNSSNEYVMSVATDASGNYSFDNLAPDDYLIFMPPWGPPSPYLPEVWPGTYCNTHVCDAVATGSKITVGGSSVGGKDFSLESGFVVSGLVKDFNTNPVEGANVCIHYSDQSFTGVCGGTDSNGYYETPAVPPGTGYTANVEADNQGLKRQVWDGQTCDGQCDLGTGSPIDLSSGDAPDTHFNLVASDPGTISGYLLKHDDSSVGGGVRILDENGDYWGDFWTDENGYWETHPLPTGTYYAVTWYTDEVIDDVWDGGDGAQCPNNLCNPLDWAAIQVSSGESVTGIDFRLEDIGSGGGISGHVLDGSSNPLKHVIVFLKNSAGHYLRETRTDKHGYYEFPRRVDDDFYVSTYNGPLGLGAELYDNIPCVPSTQCNDPAYITANGHVVTVSGSDRTGIDFALGPVAGHVISGKVKDNVTGAPLSNVWVTLYDSLGNWLQEFETDENGDYYLTGLADGSYIVFAEGVPHNFEQQVYDGVACHNWSCDPFVDGTPVAVSGGNQVLNDIRLMTSGTRIAGQVFRSDNGEPVSSDFGRFEVNLFNAAGEHIDTANPNTAGFYQFYLDSPGDYYLSTNHDENFHALINECFDNVQCADIWNPKNAGGTKITVAAEATFEAIFTLDAATVISGRVTDNDTGLPIAGVQVDVENAAQDWGNGTNTDSNGEYRLVVPGPDDYWVYTPSWGMPAPYLPEVWQDKQCNTDAGCDLFAVGNAITVGGTSETGKDFSLESGFVISGFVKDDGAGIRLCHLRIC